MTLATYVQLINDIETILSSRLEPILQTRSIAILIRDARDE